MERVNSSSGRDMSELGLHSTAILAVGHYVILQRRMTPHLLRAARAPEGLSGRAAQHMLDTRYTHLLIVHCVML